MVGSFQFYNSAIKAEKPEYHGVQILIFQFYNSAIKARLTASNNSL